MKQQHARVGLVNTRPGGGPYAAKKLADVFRENFKKYHSADFNAGGPA
jgi:hypothetical protein